MAEEKLSNIDAQSAILNNLTRKALDTELPPSERARRWKDLAFAQETKVFHNEGEVVYSDPVEALQIQVRAMENISKIMNDYPNSTLSLEGQNGQRVTFEMNFSGKEDHEKE